jgi:hypothetical protein
MSSYFGERYGPPASSAREIFSAKQTLKDPRYENVYNSAKNKEIQKEYENIFDQKMKAKKELFDNTFISNGIYLLDNYIYNVKVYPPESLDDEGIAKVTKVGYLRKGGLISETKYKCYAFKEWEENYRGISQLTSLTNEFKNAEYLGTSLKYLEPSGILDKISKRTNCVVINPAASAASPRISGGKKHSFLGTMGKSVSRSWRLLTRQKQRKQSARNSKQHAKKRLSRSKSRNKSP